MELFRKLFPTNKRNRSLFIILLIVTPVIILFHDHLEESDGFRHTVEIVNNNKLLRSSFSLKNIRESINIQENITNILDESETNITLIENTLPTNNNINQLNTTDIKINLKRGIVLCVYDKIVYMAASLIKELRCLGNMDPIQIYHCFPQELSSISKDILIKNNILITENKINIQPTIEFIDACSIFVENKKLDDVKAKTFRSYWLKPLALYHTSFDEVMLIDADDIFIYNPDRMWNNKGYVETGTLFFYDRVIDAKLFFNTVIDVPQDLDVFRTQWLRKYIRHFDTKQVDKTLSTSENKNKNLKEPLKISEHLSKSFAWKGETAHEQDSSLVLFNKKKNAIVMEVIWYMITRLRFEFVYSLGDKETFWLACELSGIEYHFSSWGAGVISSSPNNDMKKHPETLCGSLLQYLPDENDLNTNYSNTNNTSNELFYINGRALIMPIPFPNEHVKWSPLNNWYNVYPTHISPRRKRSKIDKIHEDGGECMTNHGSQPVPDNFFKFLARRRSHYAAISLGTEYGLNKC